jgi:hypothetical protein
LGAGIAHYQGLAWPKFWEVVSYVLLLHVGYLSHSHNLPVQVLLVGLALYYWPDWPLQDELRRTGAVDLAPIVARYQAALAESYAIAGDLEPAAAMLRTVDASLNQMDARIWWYNHIGEP